MQAASLLPPTWVDTPASFRAMLVRLQGEPALALDTESNSLYVYREQLCLVQISVPGADFLVDPLAPCDLAALGPILEDPNVLKVLHGAEYDLVVLNREYGHVLQNLFDTMWASRILGWPEHGLAALLRAHFGVEIDKKYQRANWGVRPLPPEQLDYARLDTHYLLRLRDIQAQALTEARRWPQARHRFSELTRTRSEAREFDPEAFWKLPGVRDLDDVARGVLRALFVLRERCAEAANVPPFKMMSNQVLLLLCDRRPSSLEALRKVKGLSRRCQGSHASDILAAIREGQRQPVSLDQRPRTVNATGRPSPECQARYEALRVWRNALALARGVEPDLVLTNHALWGVAWRNPRTREDLLRDGLLADWQVHEFGELVLAVVSQAR